MKENAVMEKSTVSVYLDNGVVCSYEVADPMKGREHAYEIIMHGYRTVVGDNDLEWFPPHRVKKVKVKNGAESSDYRDTKKAT
jgi:hypothetical protein